MSSSTTEKQIADSGKSGTALPAQAGRGDRDGKDGRDRKDGGFDRKERLSRSIESGSRIEPDRIVSRSSADIKDHSRHDGSFISRTDRGTAFHSSHRSPKVIYEDRRHHDWHRHRNDYVYRDHRNRLCYRIIAPDFHFSIFYNWGHYSRFCYVYPYYHRRYVFVSLGGYWPDYRYVRYYWYPGHLYNWYGYAPVAREVAGDTYNYYTYNYYYDQSNGTTGYVTPTATTYAPETYEQQQTALPDAEALSDVYFDEAVKAFELGDYETAKQKLVLAMEQAPEDRILPYALAQALFAQEYYAMSAKFVRVSLDNVTAGQEGVFYPRGLYVDEEALNEQIAKLEAAAAVNPADTDMKLLLGYQLLGIGEVDRAIEALNMAAIDTENAKSVNVLLELAQKTKAENIVQ